MEKRQEFPGFSDQFSDLNQFIHELVSDYSAGRINSWDDLEEQVNNFFTPSKMEQMETRVSGWGRMASYAEGITLVHVMCVFLGMVLLPEFQRLNVYQQDLMKWVILFHDIDKFHIGGKKDTMHAFRSGVVAADQLAKLGFPCTQDYVDLIQPWSESTCQAFIDNGNDSAPTPDNRKLPHILEGIEQLFGPNTPATLIVKTILLHISLHVDYQYSTPAPLTMDEARLYINASLLPLLRVMMLSDNEGWSLFSSPERRKQQRRDTLAVFEEVERLISSP